MRAKLLATAAVAALAMAVGCASRPSAPGRVPDAAAPPRSAFERLPDAEVAGAKNAHDFHGKPLCQRCHLPDLKLTNAPNALCRECHDDLGAGHRSHPVDVVQKTSSGALPLLAGGNLACHTCHDPHRAKPGLRKPFNQLCKECHRGH